MYKVITIEQKDRLDLLKYVNVLREFNCNTSEKVPISYEHVCEIETLMFKLTRLLEFEQPHDIQGGWYTDYQLKENLPEEEKKE